MLGDVGWQPTEGTKDGEEFVGDCPQLPGSGVRAAKRHLQHCSRWPIELDGNVPQELADELWIHLIDNVGAQTCLVKGSASRSNPDEVIGLTWERVAKLRTWLYTERVASADNPVDGLSRGRMAGPWKNVLAARLPRAADEDLAEATRERQVSGSSWSALASPRLSHAFDQAPLPSGMRCASRGC